MIEFIDPPYRATNTADGFEVLVQGLVLKDVIVGDFKYQELFALCIDEEGVFHEIKISDGSIATDWRYDRKGNKGWHTLKPIEAIDD